MAENCIILKCTCDSPDQDKIYGLGRRLHNKGFKGSKELGKAYCTVCAHGNRVIRISFKRDPQKGMGPLDKDTNFSRIAKNYEPKRGKADTLGAPPKVDVATATVVKSSAPVRKDKEAVSNKKAKAN